MQIRGSRHPVENRTDFHPTGVFDLLERFVILCSFFQLHPLFCFCLSLPPGPIGTFFALPVLYQLAQKEWAPCNSGSWSCSTRLPTELHGCAGVETCPGKDLCSQRGASPPPTDPWDPPGPTAPPHKPSFRWGTEVPFCRSTVRHDCLCWFQLLSKEKNSFSSLKANAIAIFWWRLCRLLGTI